LLNIQDKNIISRNKMIQKLTKKMKTKTWKIVAKISPKACF